jgi:hypothetical protein
MYTQAPRVLCLFHSLLGSSMIFHHKHTRNGLRNIHKRNWWSQTVILALKLSCSSHPPHHTSALLFRVTSTQSVTSILMTLPPLNLLPISIWFCSNFASWRQGRDTRLSSTRLFFLESIFSDKPCPCNDLVLYFCTSFLSLELVHTLI